MNTKSKQTLYDLIEIRYADPICSISITDKQLLLGSMMGRTLFYTIQDKKVILLSEQSNENITGTSIIDNNTFMISVGDDEVQEYTTGANGFPSSQRYCNYEKESEHNLKCESTFTMLSNNILLLLILNLPQDHKSNIESTLCNYTLKEFPDNIIIDTDQIEMTNYSIPFDMTKDQLAFVEYLSEKERNLVLFNFQCKEKKAEKINKAFGHISFFKILPEKRLLIVKSYNIIEILSDEFQSIKKILHSQGEIIAIDWMVLSAGKLVISILDINSNITFYQENDTHMKLISQFNLFSLSDIKQEYKDKLFFSMGYPYYIKFNKDIIAITTDNGCFLIKHYIEL